MTDNIDNFAEINTRLDAIDKYIWATEEKKSQIREKHDD